MRVLSIVSFAFTLFAIGLFSSCGKNSACGKGTGTVETFTRELTPFSRIRIYDRIDVELKPSTVNRVTLTCGKNLANYIVTEVNNNELIIRNDNKCNFLRSYKKRIKIVLEYTSLDYIFSESAGLLTCTDTLKQPYLKIEGEGCSGDVDLLLNVDSIRITLHTGNANVKLSGNAGNAYFYSGGTSFIRATNLTTNACFANNSGTGDFYVNANVYLFALVTQQGYIFYSGSANPDFHDEGKGQILPE